MGRRIIALSTTDAQVRCAAALEGPGSKALGADAGELAGVDSLGVVIADRLDAEVDVVIDFSTPAGSGQAAPDQSAVVDDCLENRRPRRWRFRFDLA